MGRLLALGSPRTWFPKSCGSDGLVRCPRVTVRLLSETVTGLAQLSAFYCSARYQIVTHRGAAKSQR